MRHEELMYLLALQETEGVGDITAKKLVSHFQSARQMYAAAPKDFRILEGLPKAVLDRIKGKPNFAKAEAEARFILDNGISWSVFNEASYPEKLRHCPDGPLLFFYRGNPDLHRRKIISIVGTRKATAYGIDACRELVSQLAPLDPVIVSGLAFGTDITAHMAAVEHGLHSIAVVAHGLNQVYPRQHARHLKAILENGAVFSEFRSYHEPMPEHFVKRNRIVAGLSEATIVIESAEKGGSLITARLASDYNREVFALPGRSSDVYSRGCNNLIKTQRAQMFTGAADIIYQLNWDLKPKPKAVQHSLFVEFSPEEQRIYAHLSHHGKELFDLLALECALPVSRLSALLLGMELKGVVRPLPGKYFELA